MKASEITLNSISIETLVMCITSFATKTLFSEYSKDYNIGMSFSKESHLLNAPTLGGMNHA